MKTIKLLAIALLGSLLSVSCLVDDEAETQGQAETSFSAGFERSSFNYVFTPDVTATQAASVHVDLVGGNGGVTSSSDIVMRYEIDPASTAISGTEYSITSTATEFTIPAGRDFATETFDFEVYPTGVALDTSKVLIINLIPVTDGVIAGLPWGRLTINIEKCDPPLIGAYTVANGNFGGDGETVNIVATGCNSYTADNLAPFTGVYSWNFTHDQSDDSVVISGNLAAFSNTVSGSGTVLPSGTIQFSGVSVSDTGLQGYSFDLIPN